MTTTSLCPDCGASPAEPHQRGCDVERCSVCHLQRWLGCGCEGHDRMEAAWSGTWPGVDECERLGWYARLTTDGWEPCGPDDDGSLPDLNRLAVYQHTGEDTLYG